MDAAGEHNAQEILASLEENVTKLAVQLSECRKENEQLKSEVSSLQNILRSFKLPGTEGQVGAVPETSDEGFSYAGKVQIRQKLVLVLQKIDRELRGEKAGF
jgi:predicted RNase H-like nuclease (RuvC/YqgF family)